jgi:hypothetical protein
MPNVLSMEYKISNYLKEVFLYVDNYEEYLDAYYKKTAENSYTAVYPEC